MNLKQWCKPYAPLPPRPSGPGGIALFPPFRYAKMQFSHAEQVGRERCISPSQYVPMRPSGQRHVKPFGTHSSIHRLPSLHGFTAHGCCSPCIKSILFLYTQMLITRETPDDFFFFFFFFFVFFFFTLWWYINQSHCIQILGDLLW